MGGSNSGGETRFKPGQSGNPAGRPKGSVSLLTLLKHKLAEIPEGERRTYAEGLVDATLRDAMAGDGAARKLIWEYIEGSARQRIEHTGANGGPITTKDVSDDQSRAFAESALRAVEAAEAIASGAVGD